MPAGKEAKELVETLTRLGIAKGLLKETSDEPTKRFLDRRIRKLLKKVPKKRRKTLLNLLSFL